MAPEDVVSAAERVVADIRAHGHHICFEYAGVSTAYRSDEGTAAAWIQQFVEGYFSASEATEADATVYGTGDAALYTSLHELASRHPTAEKNEYVDIPLTESVALIRTRATKVMPEEDVYQLLFKRQRSTVLVTSGALEVRREQGMQVLRAVIKWLLLEKGWIPMHSACVAKDGRAVCVTGQKASGKTSTLLNLLARTGCDLVAIDKFLVRDGGAYIEVRGVPGKAGIRVGSAVVQPRLLDWLAQDGPSFFPRMSAEDVQRIAATNTPEQLRSRKEKIHLLPTELAELFGTSITPRAPLGLVLVPVFDLGVAEPRLVHADREQAAGLLMECYAGLLSKGEDFLLHFFDLSDAVLRERLAVLLDRHLPGLRTYELRQNHATNEQAAKLVAGVLEERP